MVLGRFLVWWATLAGLFLLFVGEWSAVGWMAAGAAGLAAGGLTAAMWRAGLLHHGFRVRWLGIAPQLVLQIALDFAIVSAALLRSMAAGRRELGAFVARDDFPGGGESAHDIGRRAWVAAAATWSPNSYVVDIDRKAGTRLSHDLVPHRPSESPA